MGGMFATGGDDIASLGIGIAGVDGDRGWKG